MSKELVHQELLLVIQEPLGISLEREEYLVQESDFDVTTKEFLVETIQGLYGVHKDQRIELLVCEDVLQVHGGENHIRRISPHHGPFRDPTQITKTRDERCRSVRTSYRAIV